MKDRFHRFQDGVRQRLRNADTADFEKRLASAASGTFALNVAFNGLLFLTSILLARTLGAESFGAYSYAIAWTAVLSIPAQMGLSILLVRDVSAYHARSAWGLIAGLLRWTGRVTLLSSFSVALVAALVFWSLRTHVDSILLGPLFVATILLPLAAWLGLKRGTMMGLHRVARGQLPEMCLQPMAFIALIAAFYLIAPGQLSASWAVGLNAIALGLALLVGKWLLGKTLPPSIRDAPPEYGRASWWRSAWALMFVGGFHVISSRTDILMLGAMATADAVGIYNVATRSTDMLVLVLMPIHRSLSPMIAGLYAAGDRVRLQQIITRTTRTIGLLSLPIAAGLIFFGSWFLLLFGPRFVEGQVPLAILAASRYFGMLMGPVTMLLIMTTHDRIAAYMVGGTTVINVILNLVLIPRWGATGAAIATASSGLLAAVLMVVWIVKKLRIDPTLVGITRP
jgi:O-antigen/teichoic acid export membrane protein